MAYLLAVIVGLGIVMWTGSRAGRTHKAAPPRFTRPIPLAAQGGVAGHAAVIGGHGTSRLLAMLELKSALEEDLCSALGLEENPGHEELVVDAHHAPAGWPPRRSRTCGRSSFAWPRSRR